jgi:hypothetical protein
VHSRPWKSVPVFAVAWLLALAPPALATTSDVNNWDLFEDTTNYGAFSASGNFLINFGWTSNMAHSSVVSANYASNLGLIGKNTFAAHSTTRKYIDQTTGLLRSTRWILRGRSEHLTQLNSDGVVQY